MSTVLNILFVQCNTNNGKKRAKASGRAQSACPQVKVARAVAAEAANRGDEKHEKARFSRRKLQPRRYACALPAINRKIVSDC